MMIKTKAPGDGGSTRVNDKQVLARFFMERMLPATATHLMRIKAGADSTMALPIEPFRPQSIRHRPEFRSGGE